MRVIGTAGHVDHGKSTLIEALTGIHPDRLKEEQAREMTIELGFAWLTLPNGEEVGIIDVPGHRDFIENMLAGIGGIDAALLIIAADEGIMPQTKEHLAILDLLQISSALIVLTKTDLASDSGWLDLLEVDIRHALDSTTIKGAPIIRVSAKNKTGIETLISNLQSLLENNPSRPNLNRPRLPIDRVFSMSGFGTVVTGTLSDGNLNLSDEIEILPSKLKGRIRGLQTHQKKEETASVGSRTAVNISGVDVNSIQRGDVLVHSNQYQSTRRMDARLKILKDVDYSIKHNDQVKIFIGASETIANLRLLNNEELNAGDEAFVQLELHDEIVAVRGDRYILRRPSPSQTIGGGVVIDHQPKGRHKLFDEHIIKSLESLSRGSPAQILLEAAASLHIATLKEIVNKSRLESSLAENALQEVIKDKQLIVLENTEVNLKSEALAILLSHWNVLQSKVFEIVKQHHSQYPLRRGIPREELKNKLKLSPKHFNAVFLYLISQSVLHENREALSMPEHKILFTQPQQAAIESMMRKFASNPYAPPSLKECQAEIGEEALNTLIHSGDLIQVAADVLFRKNDYVEIVEKIKFLIQRDGQTTLADVRDIFKTTRKYAQAILEHLDSIQVTVRAGDARKLK